MWSAGSWKTTIRLRPRCIKWTLTPGTNSRGGLGIVIGVLQVSSERPVPRNSQNTNDRRAKVRGLRASSQILHCAKVGESLKQRGQNCPVGGRERLDTERN